VTDTNRPRAVLVTGATSGLGYATAARLGQRGDTVLVHGRTQPTAADAVRRLSQEPGGSTGEYIPVHAELSSLDEVRGLASRVKDLAPGGLDVLINNAGAQHNRRVLSPDGIELTTAVVHVAPAALSRLLLDDLRNAARHRGPARVINVTSINERIGRVVTDWSYIEGYRQVRAYSNAKLMALAYMYALAERVDEGEITFSAADPGFIFTDFGRKAGGFAGFTDRLLRPVAPYLIASPDKAARRSVLLAANADAGADAAAAGGSGLFYAKGSLRTSSKRSRDPSVIKHVYELTERRLSAAGL
jgi:retinol dehydrogenase 12